jgi:hypothetical protein
MNTCQTEQTRQSSGPNRPTISRFSAWFGAAETLVRSTRLPTSKKPQVMSSFLVVIQEVGCQLLSHIDFGLQEPIREFWRILTGGHVFHKSLINQLASQTSFQLYFEVFCVSQLAVVFLLFGWRAELFGNWKFSMWDVFGSLKNPLYVDLDKL